MFSNSRIATLKKFLPHVQYHAFSSLNGSPVCVWAFHVQLPKSVVPEPEDLTYDSLVGVVVRQILIMQRSVARAVASAVPKFKKMGLAISDRVVADDGRPVLEYPTPARGSRRNECAKGTAARSRESGQPRGGAATHSEWVLPVSTLACADSDGGPEALVCPDELGLLRTCSGVEGRADPAGSSEQTHQRREAARLVSSPTNPPPWECRHWR